MKKHDRLNEEGIPFIWIIIFLWWIWPSDAVVEEPVAVQIEQVTAVPVDTTQVVPVDDTVAFDLDLEYRRVFGRSK